jgi:hypothetical protein
MRITNLRLLRRVRARGPSLHQIPMVRNGGPYLLHPNGPQWRTPPAATRSWTMGKRRDEPSLGPRASRHLLRRVRARGPSLHKTRMVRNGGPYLLAIAIPDGHLGPAARHRLRSTNLKSQIRQSQSLPIEGARWESSHRAQGVASKQGRGDKSAAVCYRTTRSGCSP